MIVKRLCYDGWRNGENEGNGRNEMRQQASLRISTRSALYMRIQSERRDPINIIGTSVGARSNMSDLQMREISNISVMR